MSILSPSQPIPGGATPLHGSDPNPQQHRRAQYAEQQAVEILDDQELKRILSQPRGQREVVRGRQIFVNRNLRMEKVSLVGFDMDYTLAIYHMRRIEQLSFDMTLAKLICDYQYPSDIGLIHYDHHFGMRGLVVDKLNGNLIKMDRFGHVGRAYHGRRPLSEADWKKLYRHERIRLKNPKYAWIDTLFALPEACLFAGIIELIESCGHTLNYAKLYDDIREAIDTIHRDNSLKTEILKNIGWYIFKDPELGPSLHKLRSGGKKLFLLTNSYWGYTQQVMQYLLDGVLPEYPTWRHYFDFVITGAAKPAFFSETRPFIELDASTSEGRTVKEAPSLDRSKVYQGGNLASFEKMTHFSGEEVLYIGDHIYGDILKSKKSSLWRTCMVIQEIEDEIAYTQARTKEILHLSRIELIRAQLDDEINHRKVQLNLLERRLDRAEIDSTRQHAKADLEKLRRVFKETTAIAEILERDVEEGFNPYWGLLFKEGNENSRFGEQVEQYACIYTSRASNLLHYSPMQYFRSPRDLMPHEQSGALSGKMSPLGGEGPPKGSIQT